MITEFNLRAFEVTLKRKKAGLLPLREKSDLFGVFRRGNKPSVLPRDSKTGGATIERASLMRAEGLKNKKNLVYNSSGLATALLKYRRFFK